MYLWINSSLTPRNQAKIPFDNSAYLYGIGIFETLRATNGKVLFFDKHWARFCKNARTLHLKIPLNQTNFQKALYQTLFKNSLQEATVRIMLSRLETGKPHLVIWARPYEPYPAVCYRQGGSLILAKSVIADELPLAQLKSTSYLTRMLAREEAKERKATESLLLDRAGFITEGASSNIFIVKNGKLFTPPLTGALLPGTRRQVVCELAQKLKISLVEKKLTPKNLFEADEIFITSSLKDILPISRVENKKIGSSCPGPITQKLSRAYAHPESPTKVRKFTKLKATD